MASRSGALALVVFACAMVLPSAQAGAAEEAYAPTVTGETGLFTLLSGDTLPRGGWSFSLYYNNWDRIDPLTGPEPGDPGRDFSDAELDALTRLSASLGYGITDRWEHAINLPYEDFDTGDPNDVFDLGAFQLGGTDTRDFFVEIFKPAAVAGEGAAWTPDDAEAPRLEIDWNHLTDAGQPYEQGYTFWTAGGIHAQANLAGRSLFDHDGNGRRDDVYPGQVIIDGTPATVRDTQVVPASSVRSARAARLRVLPDCGRPLTLYRGQFRGALLFDAHKGSRAARRRFRRHIGGTLATNAPITGRPELGAGGKLALDFAGCGRGHVEVFATLRSLGLPPVVRGLRRNVAAELVDVRVDGKRVRKSVRVRTARQRTLRRNKTLWPRSPIGRRRDQVGVLIRVSGRLDRTRVGSVARGRRFTLNPRRNAVRFVARCLRRGGSPRRVGRGIVCRRRR